MLGVMAALCMCAGCSKGAETTSSSSGSRSGAPSGPVPHTSVVSVSSTSQLSDMVEWTATNKTGEPEFASCVVLVLHGSTQLGDYGPVTIAVATGATAEEFSEVTTLAGNSNGDTAQVLCRNSAS
jgi:hypothetical protein